MAAYSPSPGDLPPVFGPYEVLDKIGKGGGIAYEDMRGSRLKNLDVLLREETGLPVMVSETPQLAVVLGTGKALDELKLLKEVTVS